MRKLLINLCIATVWSGLITFLFIVLYRYSEGPYEVKPFYYKDHEYVYLGHRNAFTLVHNPDCKICKSLKLTINVNDAVPPILPSINDVPPPMPPAPQENLPTNDDL